MTPRHKPDAGVRPLVPVDAGVRPLLPADAAVAPARPADAGMPDLDLLPTRRGSGR
jgi:hypothetical protein